MKQVSDGSEVSSKEASINKIMKQFLAKRAKQS
jgi:hypothetical protein